VFGAKDAQQLALIRQMVLDLDLGVQVVSAPLYRDPDGLATSSRNAYLSDAERTSALALSAALAAGTAAAGHGAAAVLAAASLVLDEAAVANPPVEVDYLVLADPQTFTDVATNHRGPAILLVAAKVGTTRLIDNVAIEIGSSA
jgi:pantoate--beta-alanine ligase